MNVTCPKCGCNAPFFSKFTRCHECGFLLCDEEFPVKRGAATISYLTVGVASRKMTVTVVRKKRLLVSERSNVNQASRKKKQKTQILVWRPLEKKSGVDEASVSDSIEEKARENIRGGYKKCNVCGECFDAQEMALHLNSHSIEEHRNSRRPLYLFCRRGSRINESIRCNVCQTVRCPVWRYSDSSRGVVYICSICKPGVLNKSFVKLDAMDYALSGGAFGSG